MSIRLLLFVLSPLLDPPVPVDPKQDVPMTGRVNRTFVKLFRKRVLRIEDQTETLLDFWGVD